MCSLYVVSQCLCGFSRHWAFFPVTAVRSSSKPMILSGEAATLENRLINVFCTSPRELLGNEMLCRPLAVIRYTRLWNQRNAVEQLKLKLHTDCVKCLHRSLLAVINQCHCFCIYCDGLFSFLHFLPYRWRTLDTRLPYRGETSVLYSDCQKEKKRITLLHQIPSDF